MKCQEVMELMQRQLDGDLQTQEQEELYAHLMHCLDCAEMFERLQRLSDELTQLPKVLPPYSLVDAILPQLSEIDKHAAASITEPTTALQTQPSTARRQAHGLPWTRRIGSQFSWKFAGGVVAAGLIIGFFAFNMKHPVLDQADSLLLPKAKSESSSTSQSAPAAEAASGAAAGAADKKVTQNSDAKNSPSPAASDGLSEKKKEPAEVVAPQATSGANLEKPKVLDQSGSATSMPKERTSARLAPSTSEPERMKDAGTPASTANVEPSANPTEPAVTDPETVNKQSEEPKDATALKVPEPTSSPMAKKNGIYSLTAQTNAPLKSATGSYEAVIEQHHVVIRDSFSQEIVFASKQLWQESDEIKWIEWSKDDKLSYKVMSGDSSKTFVIDVKSKTEVSS